MEETSQMSRDWNGTSTIRNPIMKRFLKECIMHRLAEQEHSENRVHNAVPNADSFLEIDPQSQESAVAVELSSNFASAFMKSHQRAKRLRNPVLRLWLLVCLPVLLGLPVQLSPQLPLLVLFLRRSVSPPRRQPLIVNYSALDPDKRWRGS